MTNLQGKKTALLAVVAGALVLGYAPYAPAIDDCRPPRFAGKAPEEFNNLKAPSSPVASDVAVGKRLYFDGATDRFACATCHGDKGQGNGEMAKQYDPRPSNFSCAGTFNGITDGQLFWIIRFGSTGTAMPAHANFSDEQIWQLVAYVRVLLK